MLKIPETVKLIIADFDGIMTDNCVYIDEKMSFTRKINFKDVMAISRLRKIGVDIIFISGEKNPIIDLLSEKFDLKENYQDIRKKIDVVKDIVEKHHLREAEYLYIGDDINDKESLEYSKIKVTVPNAAE